MRMGSSLTAGITFSAARMSGGRQNRVAAASTAGCGLRFVMPRADCRMSLVNCTMKHICAKANPPICPSKLPTTPIASPMLQRQKLSVITRGSNPMPPRANIAAGKASRMANRRDGKCSLPAGKKNHVIARRKTMTTMVARGNMNLI